MAGKWFFKLTSSIVVSAASWRTWSLAVKAMALLGQPMVRAPPRAHSPPSSLPVGAPLVAPVPAPLNHLFPPRCYRSRLPCLHLLLYLPQQQWLMSPDHRPSHQNTSSHRIHLAPQPPRNAALFPAGLVPHLLLRFLLLLQVKFFGLFSLENVLHICVPFAVEHTTHPVRILRIRAPVICAAHFRRSWCNTISRSLQFNINSGKDS